MATPSTGGIRHSVFRDYCDATRKMWRRSVKPCKNKLCKLAILIAMLVAIVVVLRILLILWSNYADNYIRRHLDKGSFISWAGRNYMPYYAVHST